MSDDLEFLLAMMTKGWRMETDCGPWVQFVQDRFAPHQKMPPVRADRYATTQAEFDDLAQACAEQAFWELKKAHGGTNED